MSNIRAIDLFCGTGGLSLGLQQAGIEVVAGIDLEHRCKYPYEHNLKAQFIEASVVDVTAETLNELWGKGVLRLLAGCAPCQPFSSQRRGKDPSQDKNWRLLDEFGRLVCETHPEYVTMENVPLLARNAVFERFVQTLEEEGYSVDYGVLYGPDFGLPQKRRRLVLVGALAVEPKLPKPTHKPDEYVTVESAIGALPRLASGEHDPRDPLHYARRLSPMNLKRAQHSRPGGTWQDWPMELRLPCQMRDVNANFGSFYGRMRPDEPSPTITTQPYNTGAGRFTHPSQDRGLTLREAAILQDFQRTLFSPGRMKKLPLKMWVVSLATQYRLSLEKQ